MDAETVAAALEREHHEIDAGVEVFVAGLADGEPDPEPLACAVAALRRHIYLEEEFLFPPLRAAGLIAPVFVMVREQCDLQDQLRAHNPKEEQILYPQAGQVLTETATAELRALLDAGQLPEGWVCQAVRS